MPVSSDGYIVRVNKPDAIVAELLYRLLYCFISDAILGNAFKNP